MTDSTSISPPTPDNRVVFGYVRVSTEEQEVARQEASIPATQARLPDGLADLPLRLFYDHGISAWTGKTRPDFEQMLRRIEGGEAACLIVDTSSRLTRGGISQMLDIRQMLARNGTRLFTADGREFTDDVVGWITLILAAQGDTDYSKTLSHNVRGGKKTKSADGKWVAGWTPIGYRRNEAGHLEATADLPHVARAFQMVLEGAPYSRVCAMLTATVSEERLALTKHGEIRRDALRFILKSRTYLGVRHHEGTDHAAPHEAAVTEDTFQAVQTILAQRAAENFRPPKKWAFAGVAKCAACKRRLSRRQVVRNGQVYGYVRCTNNDCERRDKNTLAQTFETTLILNLAALAACIRDQLAEDEDWAVPTTDITTRRATSRQRLAEATDRLATLAQLVKDRALTPSDPDYVKAIAERDAAEAEWMRLAREARSYRDELAHMAERIESLQAFAPDEGRYMVQTDDEGRCFFTNPWIEGSMKTISGWLNADFATKHDVIASVLTSVYVHDDGFEVDYRQALPRLLTPVAIAEPRSPESSVLRTAGVGIDVDERSPQFTRAKAKPLLRDLLARELARVDAALREVDFTEAVA